VSDTLATLDEAEVTTVLSQHVVAGLYYAADVVAAGCVELQTLDPATKIKVSYTEEDGVMVNDAATVVEADLGDTADGVLHGVDAVILGGFTECASVVQDTAAPTPAPSKAPPVPTSEPSKAPSAEPTSSASTLSATFSTMMIAVLATGVVGLSLS